MKALLVAVNAKYIHTSLSVRTLKAYANSDNVEMAEYTINERVEDILRSIFLKKADVVLFSCYIWNVEVCLDVADMLKKVSPETKIIFGGPEVSSLAFLNNSITKSICNNGSPPLMVIPPSLPQ